MDTHDHFTHWRPWVGLAIRSLWSRPKFKPTSYKNGESRLILAHRDFFDYRAIINNLTYLLTYWLVSCWHHNSLWQFCGIRPLNDVVRSVSITRPRMLWRYTNESWRHYTSSSAVAERPRDTSCLMSVVSFSSTIDSSRLLLVTSASDLPMRTIKLSSILLGS